ncbi:Retrovirus-related Pol polyprotein from type-1 retrotransposable element R1 2 [Eumeta japonica]|uniref:Retrovirus-related Pol polyprotein from type-1 retrotransposable element R1 2 n=1 Tax=Eumeta variegata TaxID=151549 RepID=A0A4C1TUK0_EUMVA|nr:Retrovirus-related Pol polyprotein from type-1 retrotransposable element R1 2 [Eumeta japonica]
MSLYGMVRGYLWDREVIVRYAGRQCRRRTSKGCIQGCIAGPIFWNLILDSLLPEFGELGVYVQAFADDVVLMFSGQSASSIEGDAKQALAHVHDFFNYHNDCQIIRIFSIRLNFKTVPDDLAFQLLFDIGTDFSVLLFRENDTYNLRQTGKTFFFIFGTNFLTAGLEEIGILLRNRTEKNVIVKP